MIKIFRGKNIKDIEDATETLIPNANFTSNITLNMKPNSAANINRQLVEDENFDNYIEKRK